MATSGRNQQPEEKRRQRPRGTSHQHASEPELHHRIPAIAVEPGSNTVLQGRVVAGVKLPSSSLRRSLSDEDAGMEGLDSMKGRKGTTSG